MAYDWSTLKYKFFKLFKNKLLISFIICVGFYYILKALAPTTNIYESLIHAYATIVGYGVDLFTSILKSDYHFDYQNFSIDNGAKSFSIISRLAVKFYLVSFVILAVLPKKIYQSILVFLASVLVLYVISLFRFLIDMADNEKIKYLFTPFIYSIRYLTLYFVLVYKISLHKSLQDLIRKIDVRIKEAFQFSFMKLLLLFIFLSAIVGLVDWLLIVQSETLIDLLSRWIMWYSKQILVLFGYSATINGYQIELGNYWVYLGTPCLGAGVITIFSILISIIRSPGINKIIYIIIGINLLIFANAIRIVAILLHIYLNQIPQRLIDDYHNMSNNFFYIMVIIMLFIYTRWFKNVQITKEKKSLSH